MSPDRAAMPPCFESYPADKQAVFTCSVCGQPCTFLTRLHARAHACTGCMLRTLRPFDYTRGALALEGEARTAPAVPDSDQGHAKPTGDTRGAA